METADIPEGGKERNINKKHPQAGTPARRKKNLRYPQSSARPALILSDEKSSGRVWADAMSAANSNSGAFELASRPPKKGSSLRFGVGEFPTSPQNMLKTTTKQPQGKICRRDRDILCETHHDIQELIVRKQRKNEKTTTTRRRRFEGRELMRRMSWCVAI